MGEELYCDSQAKLEAQLIETDVIVVNSTSQLSQLRQTL